MTIKRLFLVSVCVLFSILSSAQGRYSTRLLENGTMLFFNPCKLVAMQKETSLVYDMTYLTDSDSVTVNMTYTAQDLHVLEVRIVSGTAAYQTANYSIFYREKEKKGIATRIHISCPKNTYEDLFLSATPMRIEIVSKEGGVRSFTYKKSKWVKERENILEAIALLK